ncbi:MAG: copper resistance protein CopC [Acidobacteriota bacterium]|nr:copper resistance protein CopC [Acidobacteriota bacterium]
MGRSAPFTPARPVRGALVIAAVVSAFLAAPAAAWAHAALLRTFPAASAQVDTPPAQLRLVYDEAVEPRFAVVSVTDAAGRQQVDGAVRRSGADPYALEVPLARSPRGWYLVVWRVVSADGHPVEGAFTYRIGPDPGPPPRFGVPSLSETAVTPGLIALRWLTFLSFMSAIGLFVLRTLVARSLGDRLRRVTVAFGIASAVALVATPAYVLLATAQFASRSFWSFGALVPLMDVSAFGRGYLRLEELFALFAGAAAIAVRLDRPRRPVAALVALSGALLAAGAVLLVPGAAGHAAQTPPRAASLLLDWSHLAAGSVWLGGLLGLLVLWPVPLAAVRRFSDLALGSVIVLLGSGVGAAVVHLPTLSSLWQTGYGKAILVKASLLAAAMLVAAVNLVRTRRGAAPLLQTVVTEIVLLAAAVVAAAVLSSLPPPPRALASLGTPAASVGPGPVRATVEREGYRVEVRITPNAVAVPDMLTVRLSRNGAPVRGATVIATFSMLDMEMPAQAYRLGEAAPGRYERSSEALVMVGRWGVTLAIRPRGETGFDVAVIDHAQG